MDGILGLYTFLMFWVMIIFVTKLARRLPKHDVMMLSIKEKCIFMLSVIMFLAMGLSTTIYIFRPILNLLEIPYQGNVWILWYAISFIVYVCFLITKDFLDKRKRIKEIFSMNITRIALGLSIIAIITPFVYGNILY